MSRVHENAYLHLEYAVRKTKVSLAIIGDVGCGKTTLVQYMLGNLLKDAEAAIVNQTNVLPLEFLKLVSREYGLEPRGMDKAEILTSLHDFPDPEHMRRSAAWSWLSTRPRTFPRHL